MLPFHRQHPSEQVQIRFQPQGEEPWPKAREASRELWLLINRLVRVRNDILLIDCLPCGNDQFYR